MIPAKSGIENSFLVEGEPGVQLRIGRLSLENRLNGALINDSAISVADELVTNVGGLFDFEIRNLPDIGQSTNVVLPQLRPITNDAVYRKYIANTGWVDFVVDQNNAIASTRGELGYCPPPNSALWTQGLNEGDFCVRLTIEDGGPNDADGVANGSIIDPSGVGVEINNNTLPNAKDDFASMLFNTTLMIDVLVNDSDEDGDTLEIVEASSDFGEVYIQGSQIEFTPLENYFGPVTIRYAIDDGYGIYSYGNVNVDIFINRAPIAVNDEASTDDRTAVTIDVLANDSDPENDALSVVEVSSSSGSVNIVDNQIVFNPTLGVGGPIAIDYTIADTRGFTAQGVITVQVSVVEVIDLRNEQRGSGGAIGFMFSAVLTFIVFLRRFAVKPSISLLTVLALLCTSVKTQAQDNKSALFEGTLYGTVGISQNFHSTSRDELFQSIDNVGAELTRYDSNAQGYHFGLAYLIESNWMFTAGYRNLGKLDNQWRFETAAPDTAIAEAQSVMPSIGDGLYAGVGYRFQLSERVYSQVLLEAQSWEQEFSTTSRDVALRDKRSGTSAVMGVGVGFAVKETLNVSLHAKRFKFDDDAVNSISLSLEWAFMESF